MDAKKEETKILETPIEQKEVKPIPKEPAPYEFAMDSIPTMSAQDM